MQETKKITLKYSIPIIDAEGLTHKINEIALGRLKAKHLKLLPESFSSGDGKIAPADILPLIAGLTNLSIESVDEIDIEDLTVIAEGLESFLSKSLETGKK